MQKSGCGDVRAPFLWYDRAAKILRQIWLIRLPLDPCVFLSREGSDLPKTVAEENIERHSCFARGRLLW